MSINEILQTQRLVLRKWSEADAEGLFEYAHDPAVGPIAGWPPHKSVQESLSVIQNVFCGKECYAICLKDTNKPIGSIELLLQGHTNVPIGENECELGFWIGKPFWGKGYVPEAAKEIIRHAFEDLEMRRIWCGYYNGNIQSKRVQEKCGFQFHSTLHHVPVPLMNDFRTLHLNVLNRTNITTKKAIIYVHGKGGSASEADYYQKLCHGYDVVGVDYSGYLPWIVREKIKAKYIELAKHYDEISLITNSIGTFFAMLALQDFKIKKAYCISPILNMERLINDMMSWAGVSEAELEEKKEIPTDFGETLSWEYLSFVRNNPINWTAPTAILYAGKDKLTARRTIDEFVSNHNASLTVMENGEHWFHTKEQLAFLDQWIQKELILRP